MEITLASKVFLHNYGSDDIDINMKWYYMLYIVYSPNL